MNRYETMSAEELLAALEQAGRTPDLDLIRACLERPAELTPRLLEMLATDVFDAYPDLGDEDPRGYAEIHAGLLLIAYREEKALSIFDMIFRDEERESLIEWFSSDIHHFGPAAVPFFMELVQDVNAFEYGRMAATGILSDIGKQYPETYDTIVTGLRAMLPPLNEKGKPIVPAEEKSQEVWSWVMVALRELNDEESKPHFVALFRADLIDEMIMGGLKEYLADWEEEKPRPARPFDLLARYEGLHQQAQRDKEWRAQQEARRLAQVSDPLKPAQSLPLGRPATTNIPVARPATVSQPKVGRNDPVRVGAARSIRSVMVIRPHKQDRPLKRLLRT